MWFNKAAFNNTIHGCHLYDLGAGGVRLGPPQSGVEATVNARNVGNVVSDSVLEDGGHYYKEGCVAAWGFGASPSHVRAVVCVCVCVCACVCVLACVAVAVLAGVASWPSRLWKRLLCTTTSATSGTPVCPSAGRGAMPLPPSTRTSSGGTTSITSPWTS